MIQTEIKMDANDYIKLSRIKSTRRRKRLQRKGFDKKLIRLHKEEMALWKQIRSLGWTELKPPVQKGYIRHFVLRDDVKRTKEAPFFQKILDKINTTLCSSRKDFKKKRRRFGRKTYVVREQNLRDVEEKEFFSRKFTDQERSYFYETLTHPRWSKKPVRVYRFFEPCRFVLRVRPYIITKVRVKDLDLERRKDEIERYFKLDNRRFRLLKLQYGNYPWKWEAKPKDKYKSPLHNKSFAGILDEHWPGPHLKVASTNPREPRGFSFGHSLILDSRANLLLSNNIYLAIEKLSVRYSVYSGIHLSLHTHNVQPFKKRDLRNARLVIPYRSQTLPSPGGLNNAYLYYVNWTYSKVGKL